MLREKAAFVRKIVEYFAEQGVKCAVEDDELSILVKLSEGGRRHEFRCGNIAFAGFRRCNKFYAMFERELSKLRTAPQLQPSEPEGASGRRNGTGKTREARA